MDQHILDDVRPTRWPATFVASTLLLGTISNRIRRTRVLQIVGYIEVNLKFLTGIQHLKDICL